VGRHLLAIFQLVQHVGESLGVHQAVLDGHAQELLRNVVQQLVDGFAGALLVVRHVGQGRPIGGLVAGQLARWGVDAEGEQAVELRVERRDVQRVARHQVPVEGIHVPQVKDDAMAFPDGARIERAGPDHAEQGVRLPARVL
jgi:hypothetical protein